MKALLILLSIKAQALQVDNLNHLLSLSVQLVEHYPSDGTVLLNQMNTDKQFKALVKTLNTSYVDASNASWLLKHKEDNWLP